MRCEVVAIGTELLLGQIVDTNSSWIGEQLALAGIDSHFQVKVGDNFARIDACIRQALERGDAVICCGGLGPTQDDITRDVIAHVMGVPLHRDEAIVDRIRAMFESRGRVMTDNNRRQADIPEGASPIAEMPGTAPGLYCPVGDKMIYAVPGVPSEMREMMLGTIIPDLRRRSGQTAIIRSRTLRTWGESESGLAERLAGRIEALDAIGNPTIAFLASGIEGLKVRLTAKADDAAIVDALLAAEEAEVRAILGDIVFGIDEQTMEAVIVEALRARGLTLAVAESLTGGTMASRLSDVNPAMDVFRGSAIAPFDAPGDDAGRILAAARQARADFGTDIGIAAGLPKVTDPERPGMVQLGIVMPDGEYERTVGLPGDRLRLRNYAVIGLLDFLRRRLPDAG